MPPKSKPPANAAPRRSTRARTKRPADTDLEEEEAEVSPKQPRKGPASKSQRGVKGQNQCGKPSNGSKTNASQEADPTGDAPASAPKASNTTKASKNTKANKQQAAQHSKSANDVKQNRGSPSADSSLSTQAANKPAAASKSGLPGPSNANLAAAADPACPKAHSTTVAGDADVMLNQTNIGANNNKFYRMQLLQEGPSDHWLWTRWGRVGDKSQSQLQGPFDADAGLKEFTKKFK